MTGIFDEITAKPVQDTSGGGDESSADAPVTDTSLESNDEADLMSAEPTEHAGRTSLHLREAAKELLRHGVLERRERVNLYRAAIVDMTNLNAILEPLDLLAQADEVRGLVFLKVLKYDDAEQHDEWSHPLVRKQRLTLEQTLLVAILRQYFIAYEQEADADASEALVAVDELIPQMQLYLGDSGSEARERTRLLQLLDQLKGHGLVSAPDAQERVVIRPMIAHLANPENLQALLSELKQQVTASCSAADGEEQA